MNDSSGVENYYEVLGVSPEASQAEIEKAYRARAGVLNHDRMAGAPSARRKAEEQLKMVNRAYRVLRGPVSRKRYDRAGSADWRGAGPLASSQPSNPLARALARVRQSVGSFGNRASTPSKRPSGARQTPEQRTKSLISRVRWIMGGAAALALFSAISGALKSPDWSATPLSTQVLTIAILVVIIGAMFGAVYFLAVFIIKRFFSKLIR